jgi:hydroxycarboxylate dehydrogenase B
VIEGVKLARGEASRLGVEALAACGASRAVAARIVDTLIDNETDGYASHGLMRIADYVADLRAGRLRADAVPEIYSSPASAIRHIDARHAPAAVVADAVTACLAGLVAEHGLGAVGVRNSHHLGRLAHLARRLTTPPHRVALIGFCNFQGLGARQGPPDGGPATLCTNPVLVAVPLAGDEAFILDMSTTVVSEGRVRQVRDSGVSAPPGWLRDQENSPVGDPALLYRATAEAAVMTSLGYPYAAHKGFGLALAAELLVGTVARGHNIADPGGAGNSLLLIGIGAAAAEQAHLAGDILTRALPAGQRWPGKRGAAGRDHLFLPEALVTSLRDLAGEANAG